MPRIAAFLWFDGCAEEAARHYTAIFPNSRIGTVTRYPEATAPLAGRPAGSVMTVAFELDGHPFVALNGGPQFSFTEAISFVIRCRTQAELDHYWNRLTEGGQEVQCGWLKDRFGVSWQVEPADLEAWMADPDALRRDRVMQALLRMGRPDFEQLRAAWLGDSGPRPGPPEPTLPLPTGPN